MTSRTDEQLDGEGEGEEIEEVGLDSGRHGNNGDTEEQYHKQEKHDATTVEVAGYKVEIDDRAIPYIGLIIASVVLLIAVVVLPSWFINYGYGIAVSIISIIFASFGGYMAAMNTALYDKPLGTIPYFGSLTLGYVNALFLFLWTFIAAGVLTFNGPFLVTSNGYFACWAAVLFTLMALGVTVESIRSQMGALGYSKALLLASIIQMAAVIRQMDGDGKGKGQSIYSLIVCILTILMVSVFWATDEVDKFKFYAFAVFSLLWIFLACFVTFKGPFTATGNGYFSAWLGCILCIFAASASAS